MDLVRQTHEQKDAGLSTQKMTKGFPRVTSLINLVLYYHTENRKPNANQDQRQRQRQRLHHRIIFETHLLQNRKLWILLRPQTVIPPPSCTNHSHRFHRFPHSPASPDEAAALAARLRNNKAMANAARPSSFCRPSHELPDEAAALAVPPRNSAMATRTLWCAKRWNCGRNAIRISRWNNSNSKKTITPFNNNIGCAGGGGGAAAANPRFPSRTIASL